ncbi:MAG: HAMP domain-containing sensor histidine kinase, partial [Chloroflexi bacterium]|nr:HAMP domain-containing sensor histidine kinase [Chloroflexota bacterium]
GGVRFDPRLLTRRDPPVDIILTFASGETLLPSDDLPSPLPVESSIQAALDGNQHISTVHGENGSIRVVSQPIIGLSGDVIAVVQLAESRQAQDQVVATLRNVLLAVGGAGLLFAAGAGYMLAGRTMRPVSVAFERQKAFVADAAHEFRTPLAIISANAEALDDMAGADLAPDDREMLSGIRKESAYMAALITKLLEMAKLDFEAKQMPGSVVNLASVLENACESVAPLAASRGITLERASLSGPTEIHGDGVLVRLIILSLLDNAVKYSHDGGAVAISLDTSGAMAIVRISDNGPGIPQQHLERVFDRFYRVDKARSRQTGGTGLGLAIARRAAEVLKGSLELTSVDGEGTTATIRFQKADALS